MAAQGVRCGGSLGAGGAAGDGGTFERCTDSQRSCHLSVAFGYKLSEKLTAASRGGCVRHMTANRRRSPPRLTRETKEITTACFCFLNMFLE